MSSTEGWIIVQEDGTLLLHEENDGWAFLRRGPEATNRPVTLDYLRQHYPTSYYQEAVHKLAQRRPATKPPTRSVAATHDDDDTSGAAWPNPDAPGIPDDPWSPGFHWMSWTGTGVLTIGQWAPEVACWVISYWGADFTAPADMAHLNYLGRVAEPEYEWFHPASSDARAGCLPVLMRRREPRK